MIAGIHTVKIAQLSNEECVERVHLIHGQSNQKQSCRCVRVITELRTSRHDETSEDLDAFMCNERIHVRLTLRLSP